MNAEAKARRKAAIRGCAAVCRAGAIPATAPSTNAPDTPTTA